MSWIDELKVGDKVIVDSFGIIKEDTIFKISKNEKIVLANSRNSYSRKEAEVCFCEYTPENIARAEKLERCLKVKRWIRSMYINESDTALINALYAVMENSKC